MTWSYRDFTTTVTGIYRGATTIWRPVSNPVGSITGENYIETENWWIDPYITWNWTAAYNWTETTIDRVGEEVSRNRVHDLENEVPQHRGIFTYNHFIGDLRLRGRASYYGEWADGGYSGDPTWTGPGAPNYTQECAGLTQGNGLIDYNDLCYDGEWIFDIEASYTFAEKYSVMVGVQNVADTFGPLNKSNADGTIGDGATYEGTTPWGYDGGFWYLRLRADFE